jgi:hypothetical protein
MCYSKSVNRATSIIISNTIFYLKGKESMEMKRTPYRPHYWRQMICDERSFWFHGL